MIQRTELQTERCLLRPFSHKDVGDTFEYATSPGWAEFLSGIPQPFLPTHAEEFVARAIVTPWDTEAIFALVHRPEDKVIGGISVRMEAEHRRAEFGYSLSSYYWGKGFMPEALREVVNWSFGVCDMEKVFARIQPENTRSRRVVEKLGMMLEGTLRSHEVHGGKRVDMCIYGLLNEEWVAAARQSLPPLGED